MKLVSHLRFSRLTALILCIAMLLNMCCIASAESPDAGICQHEYSNGSCLHCGAACEAYTASEWQSDTTAHWKICTQCGVELERSTHALNCVTGACRECGATGVEGETDHDWDWEKWNFDNEYGQHGDSGSGP